MVATFPARVEYQVGVEVVSSTESIVDIDAGSWAVEEHVVVHIVSTAFGLKPQIINETWVNRCAPESRCGLVGTPSTPRVLGSDSNAHPKPEFWRHFEKIRGGAMLQIVIYWR